MDEIILQHTRIKFCGITRIEDLNDAVSLGVDALGFVFCAQSPRNLSLTSAQALLSACPPFISRVGLFMNAEAGTIEHIISSVHLDLLQFHGEEPEEFCTLFNMPYIKSIAMGGIRDYERCSAYPSASGLLLDSNQLGMPGGTGEVFDWQKIPSNIQQPIILAGGLHADNVNKAIQTIRPFAVDVSSGIESSKAIKDQQKMKQFVSAVRAADGT
jgi:phosphoribosylanthranilate isomerase